MEKSNKINAEAHDMNEASKPKKSLKQRCIESHAITFDDFKKEWMRLLHKRLKENGIH
ncbi:MAG: hypothetical protein K2K58_03940 [Muribaculaceae bacterium]|nr:hypothetical protein [Muribaculaceae bacterium]